MVSFQMPTAQELADAERQHRWRSRSVEVLATERHRRVKSLRARRESIRRAIEAYRDLPGRYTPVQLRAEFVALTSQRELPASLGGPEPDQPRDRKTQLEDDYRTRPPSAKLLMHKSHALQTYLSMIYVKHAEATNGLIRSNVSKAEGMAPWAALCGRWSPSVRARRARMNRDLDELFRADLVAVGPPGTQGRYEGFRLLADDATGKLYTQPKRGQLSSSVITLPPTFFINGWHLTLSPSELAVLLVARHAERNLSDSPSEPGVALAQSSRWARYGISGEAYGAIHELEEFGLLVIHDPMPHRRHGKLRLLPANQRSAIEASGDSISPVPYRLETVSDMAFDRDAQETILNSLVNNPSPPRLAI